MNTTTPRYGIKVTAPFLVKNVWRWVTFTFEGGNKHAAILGKAKELDAQAWDFGQADVSDAMRIG